jgi:uncharacterized membrane protein YebE (DUF533 family)
MDFKKLLDELRGHASKAAEDLELDRRIEDGKELSQEAIEKIKTDRNAQIVAGGGGALLLAALLGTKGGRGLLGGVAKTGAVAALGAVAYKAWQDRQGGSISQDDAGAAGFVTDTKMDAEFAEALVRTMVAAAWSDGALNADERTSIEVALEKAGSDSNARGLLTNAEPEGETLDKIASAARSPNHAAQLFASACVVTGQPNASESGFLNRLADRLGIEAQHASAIRDRVAVG